MLERGSRGGLDSLGRVNIGGKVGGERKVS
jgi:hypothetical protein